MRPRVPWWLVPFVGSIVAVAGLLVFACIAVRPMGEAMGSAIVKAFAQGLGRRLCVPADRPVDLEVAPGAPGYATSLSLAGRQLHFHHMDDGVTTVAVEVWLSGGTMRMPVGEYDGPPSPAGADRVRPLDLWLPVLVVHVAEPADVWWTGGGAETPRGPNRADAGGSNLFVLPGKITLWAGDGPHEEIEVGDREIVWCSLGPEGLAIERRETR